jgi:hypothetical protein
MKRTIVLVAIAFLFYGLYVSGAEFRGDLSVECDCFIPAEASYKLRNDSAVTQTYVIKAVGDNKEWINLNGQWIGSDYLAVTIAAGKSRELFAFIKPQTCYVEPDDYLVTLQISNDETITQEIDVKVVPSRVLKMDVSPASFELKQCEQQTINISVENTGKSDELVTISAEGINSDWISLTQTEFLLEKGHSKELTALVEFPCDAQLQEYNFLIKAGLTGTSAFVKENVSIDLVDAQAIEIDVPSLTACNDKDTFTEITVKNNGRLADELVLTISAPTWIGLEKDRISLEAGEEETVKLFFNESDAKPGDYDFVLMARSTKFGKETEKELIVTVVDCYSVSLPKILVNGEEYTGEFVDVCMEETPVFTVELLNTQSEDISVDISVEGVSAVISPGQVTLSSGETKTVSIELDLSGEDAAELEFELVVESDYFETSKTVKLNVVDCFALEVDYNGLVLPVDVEAEDELAFTVSMRNTGIKTQAVDARVEGASFVYWEPEQLTIEPGETRGVFLYVSPPFDIREGLHKATLSIEATDFSDRRDIELNVYGGLYALIGEARVSADSELNKLIEEVEKTVELNVTITNESNALLRILDLSAHGFNADFDFFQQTLQPEESMIVKMTLFLGKGFEETQFKVPIRFETDKGIVTRDVFVDLAAEPAEATPIGLFSLVQAKDVLVVLLIIVIIALLAMLVYRRVAMRHAKSEKPSGLTEIAKEVQKIPGEKLEQIGKKRAKPAAKKRLVKKTVKKPVAKKVSKKPVKKFAKKKAKPKGKKK